MNRQFKTLATIIFTLMAWKSAIADRHFLHTGYLIRSVDSGESFKCRSVVTQEDMVSVLAQAGWKELDYPVVDWTNDEAIIVAPEIYYTDAIMVFNGLFRENNKILLSYGWKHREHENSQIRSDGTAVHSQFSSLPSTPEVLIVSFPKGVDKDIFYCSRQNYP